jgi:hypothetical protein
MLADPAKPYFLLRGEGLLEILLGLIHCTTVFAYNQSIVLIFCAFIVLMVAWNEDKTVAFRVGVGKIHVDAFDNTPSLKHRRLFLG